MSGAWLVCRERRPAAGMRLYCLPHSGGSVGEYVRWSDHLPDVEVWGVQLPGRGQRLDEDPPRAMPALVDGLVRGAELRPPFALFGHSLGALVAYELARALRDGGRPGPVQLVLSGYGAPHLPRRSAPVRHLPDAELIAAIEAQYGQFLPPEIRDDPDLLELVLPAHRADLEIVETYAHQPGAPLDVPVLVVAGSEDADWTPSELELWRAYTTARFELRLLPGGHFYLREQRAALLSLVAGALAQAGASASR